MWIKIDNCNFYIEDISIQYEIGFNGLGGGNVTVLIDVESHPLYSDFFLEKFNKNEKFNILNNNYTINGSFIRSMDINGKFLNLKINCDYTYVFDLVEKRDKIIENLLNKFDKNNIS